MRCMLAGVGALVLGAIASAADAAKPSDVKASLVADVAAVKAGMPFTLGVVLTTNPEWHIYWKNPGDSGAATEFKFQAPEGYKVELMEFPLPIRFMAAGDIVSYGYTGTTVFLATVTPPDKVEPGSRAAFGVDVSWLSCKAVCVPGGVKLALELPAAMDTGAPRADNQDLFAKARALIPAGSFPKDVVEKVAPLDADTLEISWKKQPKGSVDVFPLIPEGVEVSDIQVKQENDKTRVTLVWRRLAGHLNLSAQPLPLLVAYTDDKGQRQGFFSTFQLEGPGLRK